MLEVTAPEARCFCGVQIAAENNPQRNVPLATYYPHVGPSTVNVNIHAKDPTKKLHLLRAVETEPCVQCKANWALKWCGPANAGFAEQMMSISPRRLNQLVENWQKYKYGKSSVCETLRETSWNISQVSLTTIARNSLHQISPVLVPDRVILSAHPDFLDGYLQLKSFHDISA